MTSPADQASRAARGEHADAKVERRWARRGAGRFARAVAVLLATLTASLVAWVAAPQVERSLADDVSQALVEEGLADVGVRVDGREVTALVPSGPELTRVAQVVTATPGVLAVRLGRRSAAAERPGCARLQRSLDRATGGQRIPFSAASAALTPAAEARLARVAILLRRCRGAQAVVGGHADGGVSDPGKISLDRARVMVRFLTGAGVRRSTLHVRGYGDQFELAAGNDPAARARNHRGSVTVVAEQPTTGRER